MSIVELSDLIKRKSLLCSHRFENTASRGLTDRALSCEPQRLRGPLEAPTFDAKKVPRPNLKHAVARQLQRLVERQATGYAGVGIGVP